MNNDDAKKRRYSEEEFALILRKASEIQVSNGNQSAITGTGGLTLEEIRSIATEAGINPEAVTRAASILGALEWEEREGLAAAIFGGPSAFHLDCEIPGRLPPEEMGRVLEQIRRAAEHQGEASEVLGGGGVEDGRRTERHQREHFSAGQQHLYPDRRESGPCRGRDLYLPHDGCGDFDGSPRGIVRANLGGGDRLSGHRDPGSRFPDGPDDLDCRNE